MSILEQSKITVCMISLSLCLTATLSGLEIRQDGNKIHVNTKTLKAIIQNGAVIHLTDSSGRKIFADQKLAESSDTAGLGNMNGKAFPLSELHQKNREENVRPLYPLGRNLLYRRPNEKSVLTIKKEKDQAEILWQGLSNGSKFFPDDSIRLVVRETPEGALGLKGIGKSAEHGVFGLQIPLENLRKEGNFVLPVFGGMLYKGKSEKQGLMTFMMDALYYDAPVMTLECEGSSLGLWSQDETFRQVFAFFRRGVRSNAFALELLNDMPFEQHDLIHSPELFVNVFPESGWIAAAAPYRDWYQKQFAKEIAIRDGNFSKDIYTLMHTSSGSLEQNMAYYNWDKIKKEFGGHVAFLFYHLRQKPFDMCLPDYTPEPEGRVAVKVLQERDIKVGAYFNPLVINYNSDVFKRDQLRNFVLTRRNCIDNYNTGKAGSIPELLGGTVDAGTIEDRFAGIKDGRILYLDPLSAKWRTYISGLADQFHRDLGVDFFYLDCLGVTNDPGNGSVEGISGSQGIAKIAAEFLHRFRMPFATEYGAAPIAFASKWPLVCSSRHSDKKEFFQHRLHNQRPLSSFLFGYRPYLGYANTENQMYMVSAAGDATSGLGFVISDDCELFSGFRDHLFIRAKVFVNNRLTPYYPDKKYPDNILAMYQNPAGEIFRYYDDGHFQAMIGPDGTPLYGRLDGKTSFSNDHLALSQWPLQNGKRFFGLDPEKFYALFPKTLNMRESSVKITKASREVRLKYYYETDHYAYLEIDPQSAAETNMETFFFAEAAKKYTQVNINGKWQDINAGNFTISGKLPIRCIFSDGVTGPSDHFRYISDESGLELEKPQKLNAPKKVYRQRKYYLSKPGKSVILDGLYDVKSKEDAVDFYTQNIQFGSCLSNASVVSLLINGVAVKSYDAAPEKNPYARRGIKRYLFDYDLHHWRIPIGNFAGQKILITVKIDNKASDYDDLQIVSVPEINRDPVQKEIFEKSAEFVPAWAYSRFKPEK